MQALHYKFCTTYLLKPRQRLNCVAATAAVLEQDAPHLDVMIRTLRLASALTAALLVIGGLSATAGVVVVPVRAATAALPQDHLHFGVTNNPGDLSWMTTSGVPWRCPLRLPRGRGEYAKPMAKLEQPDWRLRH